jgi:glycosyltransferase involved in cell wall biosynthesis
MSGSLARRDAAGKAVVEEPVLAADTQRKRVSVIAPVYNEEAVIDVFVERLARVLDSLEDRYQFEIILVDDGSQDGSLAKMRRLLVVEPRLRVLELRRNYGQTHALRAGFDAARGEILVTLDSDLQHFPEDIPRFLELMEQGHDVVCGWRRERAEGIRRRWPSWAANRLLRALSKVQIHDFGTTFRAYRAELVKDLELLGDFHRYIPALLRQAGGRITELPIQNIARPAGRSSYGLGRTLGVSLDLVLLFFLSRYLDKPMRAFGKLALLALTAASAILAWLLVTSWLTGAATVRTHSGWYLMSVMMLLASIQILITGLLAEVLVRVHFGLAGKRVYAVRREWNSETPP